MPTTALMPLPKQQFLSILGTPLVGGKVYTYAAGTTNPKQTFTDPAGTTPQPNPITLNLRGEPPSAIYWSGNYRVDVRDALENLVYTVDNYNTDPAGVWSILTQLAAGAGSSLIGFLQAGAGAIAMALQAKMRQSVHVKDFGAIGDGAANDTAAIQKALDASLHVDFGGPSDNYLVSAALNLRTGHFMFGKGPTITQNSLNTETFNFEGKSNVKANCLKLVGKGDYTDSDSSRAVGFFGGVGGSNNHITRCHFVNFGYTPARFKAQSNCSFTYNTVEGPGAPTLTPISSGKNYGVLFDSGCVGALIHGNDIMKTGQGVRVEGTTNCRITSNNLHDITGQHGVYAGSAMKNLIIAGNAVDTVPLIGIKAQAQDTAGVDNLNIAITGNAVTGYGDQGILVCSAVSPATYKCRGVTVTGNTVRQGAGSGINLNNTVSAVVAGNTVDLAGFTGINFSECSNLKIDGNFVTRSGLSAIRDGLPCSHVSITNNQVVDCATQSDAIDKYGIYLLGGSEYNITGNDVSDANAKMGYAMYIAGGTTSTFCVDDNTFISTTGYAFRVDPASAFRSYLNNYFSGAIKATFNDPTLPAATQIGNTLTIPSGCKTISVDVAAPITSIETNGHGGAVVVLKLAAGVDMRTGLGNLYIGAGFVATAYSTITLACDGTNWLQVSRSPN